MKKVLLGALVMGLAQLCAAQAKPVSEVKFTPPVIKKDKKPAKANEVVFTPPVIKKDVVKKDEVKFTPPVIRKNKHAKKSKKVKFSPPVIVKDMSTK